MKWQCVMRVRGKNLGVLVLWLHFGTVIVGGKMKLAVKKMVGNEGEVGRLIEVFGQLLRYGSHRKYKYLSDEKLKTVCQTCRV